MHDFIFRGIHKALAEVRPDDQLPGPETSEQPFQQTMQRSQSQLGFKSNAGNVHEQVAFYAALHPPAEQQASAQPSLNAGMSQEDTQQEIVKIERHFFHMRGQLHLPQQDNNHD